MKRQSIGIDLDQVLNNLNKKWFEFYNEKYHDNLALKDITEWDVTKFVKPECGTDIYKILAIPGFFRNLEIQPHAQEVVKWLQKYYDVYVVSAAHFAVCGDKGAWLAQYFPFIPYQNIIFCNNKSLVHVDYLIDDGTHNLETFTGEKLLFDAEHNQDETRFTRLLGWLGAKDYFQDKLISLLPKEGL